MLDVAIRAVMFGAGNRGFGPGPGPEFGWDVSTAGYSSKLQSVLAEESFVQTLAFSADGTKMYILGDTNDTVYQYTLGTAWDLSTASYASKLKDVSAQDAVARGLAFSADGTKMYMVGDNNTVYQYTLGTAWDVGTASYASKLKDVSAEAAISGDVSFSSDGTKMYVAASGLDRVYQYTLGTAWDVGTASYASKLADVSTEEIDLAGLAFSSDGTKMYIVGSNSNTVYQYTLGTAWDAGTATYASKLKDVSTQESNARGLAFSTDGTKMYVVGPGNNIVYQYGLSTPAWSVSSATYTSLFKDVGAQDSSPFDITFNPDGTIMYIMGDANKTIFQYTLGTAWNVSTAGYASKSVWVGDVAVSAHGVTFSADGTKMYTTDVTTSNVFQYTVGTPWDVSTATDSGISGSLASKDSQPYDVFFNTDGTIMFMLGLTTKKIYEYTVGTAWNVSTIATTAAELVTQANPYDMFFKSDGTELYVTDPGSDSIVQYTLPTPWDITTALSADKSKHVAAEDGTPIGAAFSTDGTKMYVVGKDNATIFQYALE